VRDFLFPDLLLIGAGIAYFVDLFLRWGPSQGGGQVGFSGWDVQLVAFSGVAAIALLLVELVRLAGIWRTAASSLLSLLLGGFVAVLGMSGLIHLHWGGFFTVPLGAFGYGAWLGLAFAVALAAGAAIRLQELRG